MSGLNYGNTFKKRGSSFGKTETKKEGVIFGKKINKWIVRINIKGTISSIGAYKSKSAAEEIFNSHKK